MGLLLSHHIFNPGLLSFSPTFNGAQDPTVVGSSKADYEYADLGAGNSDATASTNLTVEASTIDAIINIVGAQSGQPDDAGSFAQADTDIFNLNIRPDTVRVRKVSATATDSDPTNFPSTSPAIGSFTDDTDFNPTNGVKFGYKAACFVEAEDPPSNPPTTHENGRMLLVVEFTFKKGGFNDLTVTYRILTDAIADAEDVS